MKTVHKFPIDRELVLPKGYKILKAEPQGNDPTPMLWVELDTEVLDTVTLQFLIAGTGHEIPEGYQWVSTYQRPPFVWHIYSREKQ